MMGKLSFSEKEKIQSLVKYLRPGPITRIQHEAVDLFRPRIEENACFVIAEGFYHLWCRRDLPPKRHCVNLGKNWTPCTKVLSLHAQVSPRIKGCPPTAAAESQLWLLFMPVYQAPTPG